MSVSNIIDEVKESVIIICSGKRFFGYKVGGKLGDCSVL